MPPHPKPAAKPKSPRATKKSKAPGAASSAKLKMGDKLTGAVEGTVISVTPKESKSDLLIAMLKTAGGATSKELEEAAGWQPHSVRGFLGTLRKKGINVTSTKLPKEPTIYRIVAAAPIGDVI